MVRMHHVIRASTLFPIDEPERESISYDALGNFDVRKALAEVREAGLVGMGGAGFPTWKKLDSGRGSSVVIANAAECEPLLEHNIARLETDADRVLSGLSVAMRMVGSARGIVAVKSKNVDAVVALRECLHRRREIHDAYNNITIVLLQDRYPAGDERAIVRDVLGTLLEPSAIPSKAGAVVLNVETLMRLYDVVVRHVAVCTKDITVAGLIEGSGFDDDVSLVLYDVPIGMSVSSVLAALHIHVDESSQLLIGGPYMGSIAHFDDRITATSGGIMIAGPELIDSGPIGIIVCACGASEERLRKIVAAKGGQVSGVVLCKNAVRLPNGRLKCVNPGVCPGQAKAVLSLRKGGARSILISHCTDCTNTVMQIAPKLDMKVHHATDAFMRAGGEHLIRAFRKTGTLNAPDAHQTVSGAYRNDNSLN